MGWVRSDVYFDPRGAILEFAGEDSPAIQKGLESPESIESCLRQIIDAARPDLAGCMIYGLRFNFDRNRFQATVYHASLPAVMEAADMRVHELRPSAEASDPSGIGELS